jgi:hypothetical protein
MAEIIIGIQAIIRQNNRRNYLENELVLIKNFLNDLNRAIN